MSIGTSLTRYCGGWSAEAALPNIFLSVLLTSRWPVANMAHFSPEHRGGLAPPFAVRTAYLICPTARRSSETHPFQGGRPRPSRRPGMEDWKMYDEKYTRWAVGRAFRLHTAMLALRCSHTTTLPLQYIHRTAITRPRYLLIRDSSRMTAYEVSLWARTKTTTITTREARVLWWMPKVVPFRVFSAGLNTCLHTVGDCGVTMSARHKGIFYGLFLFMWILKSAYVSRPFLLSGPRGEQQHSWPGPWRNKLASEGEARPRWMLVSCRKEKVPREVFNGMDGGRLSILSFYMAGQSGKRHKRKAQRDGPAPCPLCSAGKQQQRDVNRGIVHPGPCSCVCNFWSRFA